MIVYDKTRLDESIVHAGEGYGGVARISIGGYYGTGTLLYDGRALLTAAHLIDGEDISTGEVFFGAATGYQWYTISSVAVHPDYDRENANADLALVWLDEVPDAHVERYALYHDDVQPGSTFTAVGYGVQGIGATGKQESSLTTLPLKTQNTADGDAGDLKDSLGNGQGWTPASGSIWVSDFDNGWSSQDALGKWLDFTHTGLGTEEGLVASGDSGGPAFINGLVAGVASYTARLETEDFSPDIDEEINSSFGELAFWQKVSVYDQWIDTSLREQYVDAPGSAQEVETQVVEEDEGTQLVYFLVEFHGQREGDEELSVQYTTLDGTAIAGEDYIATQGRLVLYENEYAAVIPVEIIGDTFNEENEYFSLQISDPVGGSFADDQLTLTAVRTIVDDDWA